MSVRRRLQHCVITNFNVPRTLRGAATHVSVDRYGRPVRTAEWLEHRFHLFEEFCLPSMLGQSVQDFTWWMRYDPAAPGDCGRRLERYRAWSNVRLLAFPLKFAAAIGAALAPTTECVVTTRLDNDDALHRDAIAEIQEHCRPGTTEFLNFPVGYARNATSGELRLLRAASNAFLSFVEQPRVAPLRTALHIAHGLAADAAPVRQLGEAPRWLRVAHERNLANTLRGEVCTASDLDAEFGVGPRGAGLVRELVARA